MPKAGFSARPGKRPALGGGAAWLRWVGLVLISLTWLSPAGAGLLAIVDGSGDHELRCQLTENGFELVLHHPENRPTGHHHNLVETLLLGSNSQTEADHHLAFCSPEVVTSDADATPDEAGDTTICWSDALQPLLPGPATGNPRPSVKSGPSWRGPPAPWRGVVMRI